METAEISRRAFLKRAGLLGFAASSGLLFDACANTGSSTSTTTAAGTPKSGGVLTFARTQEALTLNPILASENGSIWTMPQLFDQLLEVRHGYPDPQPGLAESWTSSSDGLTWTFHIRDAAFSDGSPVTADDVKFSLDRFANPNINVNYAFLGTSIASTTVVNSRTVVVRLKHVDSTFLFNLAMFVPSIVPKKVILDIGDKAFGQHPVGSGPFRLKKWTRGVSLELERNPHYWRSGRPYLDGLTFNTVPDDNTRVLSLESGAVHIADAIPYPAIEQLKKRDGLTVLIESLSTWNCITLNNALKPFDEVAVRQALNYATPRQQILDTIYLGKAELANSQIGKVKYWDRSVGTYGYDPGRAKTLLKGSTVPSGFSVPILVTSGDAVELQTAEAIQAAWAEVGVKLNIDQVDVGTAVTQWYGGKTPGMLFPGSALSSDTLSSGENDAIFLDYAEGFKSFFTNYRSARATSLISEVVNTLDEGRQAKLYSEIQTLGMHDTPAIALFFTYARTGVSKSVHGFGTVPTGWWNFDEVWLS